MCVKSSVLKYSKKDFQDRATEWDMTPSHAPHFGEVWERKVSSLKSILNGTVSQLGPRTLSRDEFYTLLCEASSIINNTPLSNVLHDPSKPTPLCPAMLLTQKSSPNPPPIDSLSDKDIFGYGRRRYR